MVAICARDFSAISYGDLDVRINSLDEHLNASAFGREFEGSGSVSMKPASSQMRWPRRFRIAEYERKIAEVVMGFKANPGKPITTR